MSDHPGQPTFSAREPILLRAAILPTDCAGLATLGGESHDGMPGPRALADYLRRVGADPILREGIAVSSPPLAATLDKVDQGVDLGPNRLRRAALSVTRFLLRASMRPTPYGLYAGVALVRPGDATKVRVGERHRKGVRPDAGWLLAMVQRWEQDPAVLNDLNVVANNACYVRGDRLVLPIVRAGSGALATAARELSIRYTPVVREVLRLTRTAARCGAVAEALADAFPTGTPEAVMGLLRSLVEREVLLSDLRSPLIGDGSARHVLDRLTRIAREAVVSDLDALREVAADLDEYAAQPVGAGRVTLARTRAKMQDLSPGESAIQVDLHLDVEACLPRAVTDEIERAALALWRLCPAMARSPQLREYHHAFVDRYGVGQPVPVRDLLDPEAGLGPPAGYLAPVSHRQAPTPSAEASGRDAALGALLQQSMLDGGTEIVLDEASIARIEEDKAGLAPPSSADLAVRLLAESAQAVDDGEFRLVVSGISEQAGAYLGRFAHLVPEAVPELAELVRQTAATAPEITPAQLLFPPKTSRVVNVTQTPRLLEHVAAVGTYTDADDPSVLTIDDLAVVADSHLLYLIAPRLGRQVTTVCPHMLNLHHFSPNLARFLSDVSAEGQNVWQTWTWGRLRFLPFLPRVRYGRTILSLAHWRPDAKLTAANTTWDEWREHLYAWRLRWRVPQVVEVVDGDNQIRLDLAEPLHLHLLRDELRRHPSSTLREPADPGGGTGWLNGLAGELVVPLAVEATRPQVAPSFAAPRQSGVRHLPGGEWLYAKLYAETDRHTELLVEHVAPLVAALAPDVDRWFFVRYEDPQPHLRLRLHGDPRRLGVAVLPALRDWAEKLCADRLARDLVIATYEPELHRYGGPECSGLVEEVFAADSEAAITQLRATLTGLAVDGEILCAASMIDIARAFTPSNWEQWFIEAFPDGEEFRAYRSRRSELLDLLDPEPDWPGLRGIASAQRSFAAWHDRGPRLSAYADALRRLEEQQRGWAASGEVLKSLLHMHANRFLGLAPDKERAAYAIASAVCRARVSRRKADT